MLWIEHATDGSRGSSMLLIEHFQIEREAVWLSIRRAGGHTIAEDESTAVVFGMPAVAARLGAACEQLPLGQIAPRILNLVHTLAEVV